MNNDSANVVVLHLLVEFLLRRTRLRGPRETGVRAKLRKFYAVGFRFLDGGDSSGIPLAQHGER